MIETTALLHAYADLILRLSGAGSVRLALTSLRSDETPTIVSAGDLPPVPALEDPDSIAKLERRFADRCATCDPDQGGCRPMLVEESSPESVLFRIPVAPVATESTPRSGGNGRRAGDARPCSEVAVWLGLRYAPAASRKRAADRPLGDPHQAADGDPSDDRWSRILGLAAALAAHTRAVSRVLDDPLTGLPTRTGFRTEFGLALDHAKLSGRPLALLLLNPDGYAEINRQHGRTVGDAVLVEVASRLRKRVRAADHVTRYGGATFGVVLMDISRDDAERFAETIRTDLGSTPYCDDRIVLQFSAGVVGIDPMLDDDDGDPVTRWTRRADEALFEAKAAGGSASTAWPTDRQGATGQTVDRLQGMFTGDLNADYRNMAMLWELVQLIAGGGATDQLCRNVTDRMQAWLPARIVAIIEPRADDGDGLNVLAATVDGAPAEPGWTLPEAAPGEIAAVLRDGAPRITGRDTCPGARPSCTIPLSVEDRVTGCFYLEANEAEAFRAIPDPRFFAALASQLAIALDGARLRALQREREVERREILESEVRELRRVVQSTRLAYTSDAMRDVLELVRKIAPTEATVLVTGESGTGKELLARTIHQLSDRRDRPLIVVDCGAISATLIDSELFGHAKGAFTGAHARKIGRLAEADGATVFLDEIGELPIDVQSKLLRFVQEKTIMPVGSTQPKSIDARIIAATNVDLAEQVRAGSLREDLYHRLNVVRVHLPPLRERKGDILHLATVFLQQYATLYRKDGLRFAPETERELTARRWTGNVRELQNRIMRAVLFAEGDVLRPEDFERTIEAVTTTHASRDPEPGPADSRPVGPSERAEPSSFRRLGEVLDDEITRALENGSAARPIGKWVESDLILAAERATGGVARQAGALLGLADTTYRRRLGKAKREQEAGLAVRSETWNAVDKVLDALVAERRGVDGDLATEVERAVLEAIVRRCGPEIRTGSRLLGVTETTYLKRRNTRGLEAVNA